MEIDTDASSKMTWRDVLQLVLPLPMGFWMLECPSFADVEKFINIALVVITLMFGAVAGTLSGGVPDAECMWDGASERKRFLLLCWQSFQWLGVSVIIWFYLYVELTFTIDADGEPGSEKEREQMQSWWYPGGILLFTFLVVVGGYGLTIYLAAVTIMCYCTYYEGEYDTPEGSALVMPSVLMNSTYGSTLWMIVFYGLVHLSFIRVIRFKQRNSIGTLQSRVSEHGPALDQDKATCTKWGNTPV